MEDRPTDLPVPGHPPAPGEPLAPGDYGSAGDPPLPGEASDYEHLLDDYSHFAPPAEGEVLQGHVLKVTDKEVIVDFGYKSEGIVSIEQFQAADGTVTVKRGDTIDIMVDRH